MTKLNKTFIIRHKETKEQWTSSSGKSSWKQIGHAKSAFKGGATASDKDVKYEAVGGRSWKEVVKFDDQPYYEVVELKNESEDKLQEACMFLKLVVEENAYDNISSGLRVRINEFLREIDDT